jgi:hypothetical protein
MATVGAACLASFRKAANVITEHVDRGALLRCHGVCVDA